MHCELPALKLLTGSGKGFPTLPRHGNAEAVVNLWASTAWSLPIPIQFIPSEDLFSKTLTPSLQNPAVIDGACTMHHVPHFTNPPACDRHYHDNAVQDWIAILTGHFSILDRS